jgi:hypothetical protein
MLSTSDSSSTLSECCSPLGYPQMVRTYKWIVLIIAGLRDQDRVSTGGRLDEVMCSYICHDLCARIYARPKLLFELMQRLSNFISPNCRGTLFNNLPCHPNFAPLLRLCSWNFKTSTQYDASSLVFSRLWRKGRTLSLYFFSLLTRCYAIPPKA